MTMSSSDLSTDTTLMDALRGIVLAGQIRTSDVDRDFYSSDVFSSGARPACIVAPATVAEVQSIVCASTQLGYSVIARGGGLSYSAGYH
jgi:D-lactate dehydrogenase (cytochrome)